MKQRCVNCGDRNEDVKEYWNHWQTYLLCEYCADKPYSQIMKRYTDKLPGKWKEIKDEM